MKVLSIALSAVCLTALVGCGTQVHESLKIAPSLKTNIGQGKKVVILPFADYTEASDLESAYRRNLFVNENLIDAFTRNGFTSPVQEDVFRYLVSRNIINVMAYSEGTSSSIEYELRKEWSAAMKGELEKYRRANPYTTPVLDSPGTLGLDQAQITLLGQNFGADYVVRGSIVQYKTRQDPTWEPWKKGILTFVTGLGSRVAFGKASSDTYDGLNGMATDAGIGSLFGLIGDGSESVAWGAGIGAGVGALAHQSGRIPQAVVQLRMWVQDAYNGEVVWTNRIDVKVSPASSMADFQYDGLFETATERAVHALMDDLMYAMNPAVQSAVRDREAQMMERRRGSRSYGSRSYYMY